jgi:ribonuclease HI
MKAIKQATLYTDGGARGNPGPAGIGYVLQVQDGDLIEVGEYMGEATNNQAEYEALRRGLTCAQLEKVTHLKVYMDSELIVKQIGGEYRIKNQELRILYDAVCGLIADFEKVTFDHIPRAKNKRADELVNQALDLEKSH